MCPKRQSQGSGKEGMGKILGRKFSWGWHVRHQRQNQITGVLKMDGGSRTMGLLRHS